ALCADAGVAVANLNSPAQTVLSGTKDAIEKAKALCVERKIKAVPLPVAGAFHSPLMEPARERLAALLADVPFAAPTVPVYSNVTGKPHGADIRDAMLRQVTGAVRWQDCVRNMMAAGVTRFIEFGPGKVLSGLIARIDKDARTANVQDAASLGALQL
ncbi:MAG: ACP S-malonyltransferase, partial [Kiritimatiellaeota bacterium]|nr:ACP S-malonyltransferase [Kiritimatiellota bacterium]